MSRHTLPEDAPEGAWFACDFPERPGEQMTTIWRSTCPLCVLHMRAHVLAHPETIGRGLDFAWRGSMLKVLADLDQLGLPAFPLEEGQDA